MNWRSGLSQDTRQIVLPEKIAREVVIELKKYDICKEEVQNLDSTVKTLQYQRALQDTVLSLKNSQLEITDNQLKQVRKERNVAIAAVIIITLLAVLF